MKLNSKPLASIGKLAPVNIIARAVEEDVAIEMKDAEAGVIRVLLLDPVMAEVLARNLLKAARRAREKMGNV